MKSQSNQLQTNQNEIQITNGWQNIGICKKFARDNIPFKLRTLYMELVQDSFGFCQKITKRLNHRDLSKRYGISDKTFRDQIKELESLGLLRRIESSKFIEGGGSEAYAYAPAYPKGYGKLYFEDDMKSPTISGSKNSEPEKKNREDYKF